MIAFEEQRLPTSKKDKQWRKNQVDAICSRVDEFGEDWYRMWQNYRMKNNQIDQEEFREYCDTLGLSKGEGKKFVEPFNKTHTIIDVLMGEEDNMPWSYGVINLAPSATNEMLRDKQRMIRQYVDEMLELEIDKNQQMLEIQMKLEQEKFSPEQAEEASKQLMAKLQERESRIIKPEDIEKKFSNYISIKERAVHKLLQALAVNNNLKWIKNQTFEDALIAGVEAVEIVVDEYTGLPSVKQINALNLFFHKSSDTPFIQDSDYVGYKEELTITDVLDKYGQDLEEEDIKKLRQYNNRVFGTDAKFSSPNGESPSHWDNMKKYEYTYQHPLSTIPSFGSTNVLSEGLYASDRYRYKHENYCVVYTTYFKSQRRVGKYTYIDEYGKPATTIVGEEYPIPKDAVKKNYKPHMFSKMKTKWEWSDGNGNPVSIEWMWLPEIWKGVRINGDIHAKIEPYEHAYQSILNPYRTKIPIHGFIYNNRNAFSVSVMDRMKPWQKLYYVIMSKWLKLITQDKGVIKLLNILMMDKDVGYDRALQIAVDQGVLPYNPLAHTQGMGNTAAQMRPADRLDLSNSDQLAHYTRLLEFVEQQLKLAAGISDQRMAQTGRSTNVTDNQRDMAQSMNITNSIFSAHEMLWQEVLQTLCETTVKSLDSKSGFVRQILSDDERALIDLDLISLEDEYAVRIGNNSKSFRVLQEARQLSQALIQNDKAAFSTLIDLLNTDNLSEFKEQIKGIEADIQAREEQMAQQQQEQEQKMMEAEAQQQEAERQHKLKEIELKGEYDILKAQVAAMAWSPDKDLDRDGLPDVLEIEKFRNEAFTAQEKLNIEKSRLIQEDKAIEAKQKEVELKNKQLSLIESQKARIKDSELASKERIEEKKIKAQKQKNKN